MWAERSCSSSTGGDTENRTLRPVFSLLPRKLGRLLKIPVLKFLLHSASYLWFLLFLLGESLVMETQLSTFRDRSQSVWETSLHMIWVTGTGVGPFICGNLPQGAPNPFFVMSTPVWGGTPVDAPEHNQTPLGSSTPRGLFPSFLITWPYNRFHEQGPHSSPT